VGTSRYEVRSRRYRDDCCHRRERTSVHIGEFCHGREDACDQKGLMIVQIGGHCHDRGASRGHRAECRVRRVDDPRQKARLSGQKAVHTGERVEVLVHRERNSHEKRNGNDQKVNNRQKPLDLCGLLS
jgi:hypothetical protein